MHCINVYITKDDGTFEDVPHLKLPQDFILFTFKQKGIKKDRLVAKIETDYFGGVGDQSATVWENKKTIYTQSGYGTINCALELLGVNSEEGKDAFDTLNLGQHRTNEEIENKICL